MSTAIEAIDPPTQALTQRYHAKGFFTDAYAMTIDREVSLATFVEAFYTTRLFKLERAILGLVVRKPSTDAQARALGLGEIDAFSAWTVEAREPDQLLLRDLNGGTRSWLMREAVAGGTRLYFGSVVVGKADGAAGPPRMGWLFHALLGFHRWYSVSLMRAAQRRLTRD